MTITARIIVFLLCYYVTKCFCIHLHQVTLPVEHAEGPSWDSRKNLLYFVDIPAGNVHSFEYATGEVQHIHLNGTVTPVVQSKSDPNILIVGVNKTLVAVEWDGKSKTFRAEELTTVAKNVPKSRFNDGKADKQGRLWFGTTGLEADKGVDLNAGILYKITRENLHNPTVMIARVNISNGLVWNKANNKFYYVDTPSRKIVEYDYDDTNGDIKNKRVVLDLNLIETMKGNPDGMTIDEDDNLWVALYNGRAVIKVEPKTGHILQTVAIPADGVTSVMWGGPELDILYVTTSRHDLTAEDKLEQPHAGSVFALTDVGTKGRKVYEADIVDVVV